MPIDSVCLVKLIRDFSAFDAGTRNDAFSRISHISRGALHKKYSCVRICWRFHNAEPSDIAKSNSMLCAIL